MIDIPNAFIQTRIKDDKDKVCMKAFEMSITEKSLSYAASIVDVSSNDLSAAVGDAASSLSMVPR